MISKDRAWVQGLPILGGIWLIGAIADRIWFAIDQSVPAWDQAEYLTNTMMYWQAFQHPQWLSLDWWVSVWMVSPKVPPWTYISGAGVLSLFGTGSDQAVLMNSIYSALLSIAVYGLGYRLFSMQVGLWSAALCLLLPGLYTIRLDFLTDFPLVTLVTLAFCCLTQWRSSVQSCSRLRNSLLWMIGFGVSFGLALLTKQTALFFLAISILWLVVISIRSRLWGNLLQLVMGNAIALAVCYPWYRTNWLLILTAGKRATIDSAIAEGDPPLTSLDAWIYYFKHLPSLVSLPLFLVGLVGLLLYWKRSLIQREWSIVRGRWIASEADYGGLRSRGYRKDRYAAWWDSVQWLLVFLVGAYLLCSLNVNKDDRYITPLLPTLMVLLTQGLLLFPDRLRLFRWWAVGLSLFLMVMNTLPAGIGPSWKDDLQHRAVVNQNWHHADIVDEVVRVDPYVQSTIAVLPSVPNLNQHNINYAGTLKRFQVFGRQVGTSDRQVEQDARSLSWYLTKTGDQGSIRKRKAQTAVTSAIETSPDFQLQKSWSLPDRSTAKLYRRKLARVQVQPIKGQQRDKVRLEQVRVPNQAPPGNPIPLTYRWSGSWKQLKSGLVLLSWQRSNGSDRWLHDHAIALGLLHPNAAQDAATFQVTERIAAIAPKTAQGRYKLKATYLNRDTGETYEIAVPDVTLTIDAKAPTPPAQEVDLITQLRSLSTQLPQGITQLDTVFSEISRVNQYDPLQDYVDQAIRMLQYRSQQEPKNLEFAYNLGLAQVLKRNPQGAIAAFEKVVQLDPKNSNAYGYLAFVNLYDFRGKEGQRAIDQALAIDPKRREWHTFKAIAGLMQGNLVQAWNAFQQTKPAA